MKILSVDSNVASLKNTEEAIRKIDPEAAIYSYDNSLAALSKAREEEIDVAVVETRMPELSGLDLGKYLQELNPYVNLVFLSDGKDDAYDALKIHASGYIQKPGANEDYIEEFEHLRYPELRKKYKRVFAQTFGNFELFIDGVPAEFKYKRTKEIIAILINNRGSQTTNGEIIASLWEDEGDPEKKMSYLSNLRQDLANTLKKYKLDGIILKQRGSMAIAKDKIECDLYDWLDNGNDSKYRYTGDYMNQYSWSEFYHAELDEISYDLEEDADKL